MVRVRSLPLPCAVFLNGCSLISGLILLLLKSAINATRCAIARCSDFKVENRENLSDPRPQDLTLEEDARVETFLRTSGSSSLRGMSSC